MNLRSQRRMAAEVLNVGKNRVWIDPENVEEVSEAITKQDIRNLIESGAIKKKKKKGTSKGRSRKNKKQKKKGRRKGHGKRKGSKGARKKQKDDWKEKIRAIRSELKEKRDNEEITKSQYRELYKKAKGGFFRNKKHMNLYIDKNVKGE